MREIKFRVWDKKRKKMFDIYQIMFCGVNTSIKLYNPDGGISRWFDVEDRFILMQYTGLKDKKNRDIFEGDILATSNNGKDGADIWKKEDCALCEVRWKKEYSGFLGLGDDDEESIYHINYMEVIGNIHENPELLKGKK